MVFRASNYSSVSDVREAPLIQEVITNLGQLIRSSPSVFSGIMRIRTHFFVIAMREEISRSSRCDEEEAIEQLMRLSPYEMKTLLQQVLVAHDRVDSSGKGSRSDLVRRSFSLQETSSKDGKEEEAVHNELLLLVQSGGFSSGNFAELSITNNGELVPNPLVNGRGLNMIVINRFDGSILMTANFDLNYSASEVLYHTNILRPTTSKITYKS